MHDNGFDALIRVDVDGADGPAGIATVAVIQNQAGLTVDELMQAHLLIV
jgi:hypothetical protein